MALGATDRPRFSLSRCDSPAAWLAAVEGSTHYSIFSHPAFLAAVGARYEAWLLSEKGTPVIGVLVIEPADPDFKAPYPFSLYQGIALVAEPPTIHGEVRHAIEAIDYLLTALSEVYPRFSFCLHHRMRDLRAFQWLNYHNPERGRVALDLNYTGIIELARYKTFDDYVVSTRTSRRDERKKAMQAGLRARVGDDVETLVRLYQRTFERQDVMLDAAHLERVRAIAETATREGFGRLMVAEAQDGEAMSATLFLHDSRTAYYMFGATDPEHRRSGASTHLLFENIGHFFENGIAEIDMVGINSPNRGDFKTSFNASPAPYFVATWQRVPS